MKSFLWRVARALGLGLFTLVVLLLGFQHRMIYHPRSYEEGELTWFEEKGGIRWEVTTSQGQQTAFYLPSLAAPSAQPEFLWLVMGGNGSLALDYAAHRKHWDPRFAYLFIDYPGYGLCNGKPSPEHIRETLRALLTKVQTELQWTAEELPQRCGVLGHSLGAAVALMAAEEWKLRRAVLCTPFTTLTDMARLLVGTPLCHLNRHDYDNVKTLESLKSREGRAVLIHGTEDEVIPVRMSRELHETFPATTELLIVPGAMHNDIFHLAEDQIGQTMNRQSGLE